MKTNPYISIIVPAFNEEERLKKSLPIVIGYLKENFDSYEIVVVDDGSNDQTAYIARTFGKPVRVLSLPQNQGKGASVRKGMLEAKGQYRIFSDADLSTPISELPKIMQSLKKDADICIGSRAIDSNMIKKHQPFYREFMGKTFNKIVQVLFFKGIKDTQCGFKGFTAIAAEKIFPQSRIDGFSFDVEILYLAKKNGLKIEQTSVEWYNDERSTVSPIKDSINMLFELLRIKKIHKGS